MNKNGTKKHNRSEREEMKHEIPNRKREKNEKQKTQEGVKKRKKEKKGKEEQRKKESGESEETGKVNGTRKRGRIGERCDLEDKEGAGCSGGRGGKREPGREIHLHGGIRSAEPRDWKEGGEERGKNGNDV